MKRATMRSRYGRPSLMTHPAERMTNTPATNTSTTAGSGSPAAANPQRPQGRPQQQQGADRLVHARQQRVFGVRGHGEGARNRGGGHDELMRTQPATLALAAQGEPLLDPEPVLLKRCISASP